MAENYTALTPGKEGIDLKELRAFNKGLKGWSPDRQVKKKLKAVGELVTGDAKALASDSKTVPGTIHFRISKTKVSIIAGGGSSLARLRELGNKQGRRKTLSPSRTGHWRHPVFGQKQTPWVTQPMHPALQPALLKNLEKAQEMAGEAVREAFREQGI